MKHLLRSLFLFVCIFSTLRSNSQPQKLIDLGESAFDKQAEFVQVGEWLFFTKNQSGPTDTLWQTDGTVENTVIKGIFPGTINFLNTVEGKILIHSLTPSFGLSRLWAMAPDAEIPILLQERPAGNLNIIYQRDDLLIYDQRTGNQRFVWRTDGTPAGTTRIFTINHSGASQWEVAATDEAIFLIDRIIKKLQVISLDGQSVIQEVFFNEYCQWMTSNLGYVWLRSGDTIWQFNADGSGQNEFWEVGKYDFDLSIGIEHNGILYFKGSDDDTGLELWRTDGTIDGTYLLEDLRPGFQDDGIFPYHSSPRNFFKYQGQLYFIAAPERFDRLVLYQIDAESEQVSFYKDLWAETSLLSIIDLHQWADVMLISANSTTYGREYWIFDGTDFKVVDIRPGGPGVSYAWYILRDLMTQDYLFLNADDGIHGEELWRIDPQGNAALMTDLIPGADWSSPIPRSVVNNRVVFEARNETRQAYLYGIPKQEEENAPPAEQPTEWFKTLVDQNLVFHEPSSIKNMDMAITPDDDLLITGYFNSYVGLGISGETQHWPLNLETTRQFHNTYLTKVSADGHVKWTKTNLMYIAGSKNAVASNSHSDAIVAGIFRDNLELSPGQLINSNSRRFFLVSYDPEGNYQWHRTAETGSEGKVFKCSTDNDDNIYVAGYYTNFQARFGDVSLTSEISPAYYVVKYSPDGEVLWAQTINMTEEWLASGDLVDLKLDNQGNSYIAFGNGGYNWSSSCEYRDFYMKIARLSVDGQLDWEKTFISTDLSFPTALAVANDNRLYLAGRFRGRIFFDDHSEWTGCENSKGFLVQLNLGNGRILQEPLIQEDFTPYHLTVDTDGFLYLTGLNLEGTHELPENYQHYPFPYNEGEVVVKRYNSFLKLDDQRLFKKRIEDLAFENNPQIVLDNQGKIIMQDTKIGMIDTLGASSHISQGTEVYLTKFSMRPKSLQMADGLFEESSLMLSPNPAASLIQLYSDDLDFSQARIRLINILGQEVPVSVSRLSGNQRNLYLDHLPSGRYFIQVELNDKVYTKSFIKAQ